MMYIKLSLIFNSSLINSIKQNFYFKCCQTHPHELTIECVSRSLGGGEGRGGSDNMVSDNTGATYPEHGREDRRCQVAPPRQLYKFTTRR